MEILLILYVTNFIFCNMKKENQDQNQQFEKEGKE